MNCILIFLPTLNDKSSLRWIDADWQSNSFVYRIQWQRRIRSIIYSASQTKVKVVYWRNSDAALHTPKTTQIETATVHQQINHYTPLIPSTAIAICQRMSSTPISTNGQGIHAINEKYDFVRGDIINGLHVEVGWLAQYSLLFSGWFFVFPSLCPRSTLIHNWQNDGIRNTLEVEKDFEKIIFTILRLIFNIRWHGNCAPWLFNLTLLSASH